MGMMWTTENRPRYNRDKLRYPSDLTDEEWGHLEHLIPPAKRGGRRREIDEREVVNGLLYVLSTGCQWRYIPRDLPPRSTLFDYFQRWEYDGTLLRIHYELYQKCRELLDRQASPTACVIDSQSVKSAEKGGAHIDPSGYDAGKKINGKKRHIVVDTEGLLMHAVVHPADVQERDGGILVLASLFGLYPFLKTLFADGGYQGPKFRAELAKLLPGLAAEAGIAIEHVAKGHIRKEAIVAQVLKQRGEHPGLVHVISAMEACDAYQPWHDKQTHKTYLRPDSGKCLHYYF